MGETRDIQKILDNAYAQARQVLGEGRVASYIPELAKADPSNLGACVLLKDGTEYGIGDYNIPFTMQSISKTFSLIQALQTAGYEKVFSIVGMEPTGDSFDSILQLEQKDWRPFNPMINAGAIAVVSAIEGDHIFEEFVELVKKLCGDDNIMLNESVYHSEDMTGNRNRSIAYLLQSRNVLFRSPTETLDDYFRMCSVMVTAKNLAHYARVLANDGIDPTSGERLVDSNIVRTVKTLMLFCGMYDESGQYAMKVGMPSKSGVGGGIMAVGKDGSGIATYGPVLNKKGNSVGGIRIMEILSRELQTYIF